MSETVQFPQPEAVPPSEMTPVTSRPEFSDAASNEITAPTVDPSIVAEGITALPDPTQAVSAAEAAISAKSQLVVEGTNHLEKLEAELFAPK